MTQRRTAGACSADVLTAAWATDPGRRDDGNEDACLALAEDGVFLVSDGMGGEHAGELASALVVEWAPRLALRHMSRLESPEAREVELALRDTLLDLNHRVREEGSRLDGVTRMGATVVLAVVRQDLAHIAHMGDSRAYVLSGGELERLTHDHSVAAVLQRRGALSPEQAAYHPMRTRLSRYVGMGGNAYADLRTVNFAVGSRLLLCTDGLTAAVSDGDLATILAAHDDVEEACAALVDAAEAGGSQDNITVLIVQRIAQ